MITKSTSLRQDTVSRRAKLVVCFFSLGAAVSYRSATLLPEILEAFFLFGLSTLFLACAIFTRRSLGLRNYWEIPFAFLIFAFAGSLDIFLTQSFLANILHQSPTFTNPFASTVQGTVAAQLVSTVSIVIPIVILTKRSGMNLDSIFIDHHRVRKGLPIGVFGFVVFYSLTMTGLLQLFFPSNISLAKFLSLTPAILALTLSNEVRKVPEPIDLQSVTGLYLRLVSSASRLHAIPTCLCRHHLHARPVARLSYESLWKRLWLRSLPRRS